MLSDEDIAKVPRVIAKLWFNRSHTEQMALQRGLPSSELLKLRARLSGINNTGNTKQSYKIKKILVQEQQPWIL
jgi:hypothetical protein